MRFLHEEAIHAMCRAWHGPDWDGLTDLYSAEEALIAALPFICEDIAEYLRQHRYQAAPDLVRRYPDRPDPSREAPTGWDPDTTEATP